jgi:IMP cyclohydrolase
MADLEKRLRETSYPGRGILIGRTFDGKKAAAAYFIMGRSENSRNRVFVEDEDGIRTRAYDPSKMVDPSLIIYAPVRVLGNKTIITNGDQTDTIYEGLDHQQTFEQSLRSRTFEPDEPNYTPRISGVLHIEDGKYNYALSILKSNDGDPSETLRFTFAYESPKAAEGRFISTYMGDGSPLPSFTGEPVKCEFDEDFTSNIDIFTTRIWAAMNADNKVSLFTRFINIATGETESRIVNRNE